MQERKFLTKIHQKKIYARSFYFHNLRLTPSGLLIHSIEPFCEKIVPPDSSSKAYQINNVNLIAFNGSTDYCLMVIFYLSYLIQIKYVPLDFLILNTSNIIITIKI